MGASVALKIQLPAEERGRSDADLQRIDRLRIKLARIDLKPQKRKDAERELETLLSAPARAAQAAWETAAAQETHALAEARGEVVEAKPKAPLRIVDRDPAAFLLRKNHLTAEQYDAAVAMRDAYETRSEGVGSQMGDMTSLGGAHNNDGCVMAALQRAKRLQRVGTVERAVMLSDRFRQASGEGPSVVAAVGLQMLRGVCGEGKPLASYGKGRAFERHLKAFTIALDVASETMGRKA